MNILDIPKSWDKVRIQISPNFAIQTYKTFAKSHITDKEYWDRYQSELQSDKPRKTYLEKYRRILSKFWVIPMDKALVENYINPMTNELTFEESIQFINKLETIKKK
jgi:hypothetical protein